MREIEQRGLYYDEFESGVKYLHRPGRTVTEADNVFFTTMTMNTQALHLDGFWAETQEFGQRLVNSMFTLSTVVGMSVAQLTQGIGPGLTDAGAFSSLSDRKQKERFAPVDALAVLTRLAHAQLCPDCMSGP